MEIGYWILTAGSLAGVILNIHHRKECFYIWSATNFSWAVIDFTHGIYAQSALFAVYFVLALYGIRKWR